MTLRELFTYFGFQLDIVPDREIVGVTQDSSRVSPGYVFVARVGEKVDGHDFAEEAVRKGAVAVIGQRDNLTEFRGVPYLRVAHPIRAAAELAHAVAFEPTQSMWVAGVTGTNGKSSTVNLIHHILSANGRACAQFGTLGCDIGGQTLPVAHTTPFGEDLAPLFRKALLNRCTHAVMEVSSHALAQERVASIDFDAAVFTNLTQDHLDYHGSMEDYLNAKLRLFERIDGKGRFTVVNAEDEASREFAKVSRVPCFSFGGEGDVRATNVRREDNRMFFRAETRWGHVQVETGLIGRHNLSNVLAAMTTCTALGIPLDGVAAALASARAIPGRFEHIDEGQDFQVVVDYAHTDDGLRNVLVAARELCKGTVILVFGCGGDRDRGKRGKMAMVASDLADYAILTSDNPRTEDPRLILDDIEEGMRISGCLRGQDYEVIQDRREAIRHAIGSAESGDLVLVAGKGHEDYQIIGTVRHHFDDREVVRELLHERCAT